MSKKDFRNVKQTQYDSGQVIKGSFSEQQSALRVYNTNTILKDSFTHLVQEFDDQDRVVKVDYFQAISPSIHRLSFRADNEADLAGKYFKIFTFLDKKVHVFYYKVDGVGDEPTEGDYKYVINIKRNDPVSLIAYSSRNFIRQLSEFKIIGNNLLSNYIDIEYNQFGESELIDVNDTGFTAIIQKEGESVEVGNVQLSYDENNNIIYNGNTLKGMYFNPYTANFDSKPGFSIADNKEITSTEAYGKQSLDVNIVDEVKWDSIETTFPDLYTELYTYKKNGLAVQTVRVSYQDSNKKVILLVEKTRL